MLNVSDSGVYQCAAENKYQIIYANAELRVLGKSFLYNQKSQNDILASYDWTQFLCKFEIAFPWNNGKCLN